MLKTSERSNGAGISSRMSLPGLVSPSNISAKVSSPTVSVSAKRVADKCESISMASAFPNSFSDNPFVFRISLATL